MPAYYVGISLYGLRVFGDTSKPNRNAHVFYMRIRKQQQMFDLRIA